jgi:hypothetical protein
VSGAAIPGNISGGSGATDHAKEQTIQNKGEQLKYSMEVPMNNAL